MVEHRFRSITYAAPNRVRTRRPEAFRNQGGVRRVDEVGRSIGYRPIQVENDRGTVNGLLPRILSALAPTLGADKLSRRKGTIQALRRNRAMFWLIHARIDPARSRL
jgi:hypothetical protein